MNNSELILKALGVASNLTYNEEPQGSAKHVIRELAHRLDRSNAIHADEVAHVLAAVTRIIPRPAAPAVAAERIVEMRALAALYEIMEVLGLRFADEVAQRNATPNDVFRLAHSSSSCVKAATAQQSNAARG